MGIGLLGVSLAFGLTVLTMAFAIGHISGCQNPAVSIGLWACGRFSADKNWCPTVVQVLAHGRARCVRIAMRRAGCRRYPTRHGPETGRAQAFYSVEYPIDAINSAGDTRSAARRSRLVT